MSHLVIPAILANFISSTLAATYTDDEERVLDQIVPEKGDRVRTTLAEVERLPLGPIPSLRRLRAA